MIRWVVYLLRIFKMFHELMKNSVYSYVLKYRGEPGWRSRYSDLLRAGSSGYRIPVGVEIFRNRPDRLRGPPSLLYSGYRVFPGGKGGRGVMLTTHPLLVPRLRKSWTIPPLTLWVPQGLLRSSLYLLLKYRDIFLEFYMIESNKEINIHVLRTFTYLKEYRRMI